MEETFICAKEEKKNALKLFRLFQIKEQNNDFQMLHDMRLKI
jgi:hypothetical protein